MRSDPIILLIKTFLEHPSLLCLVSCYSTFMAQSHDQLYVSPVLPVIFLSFFFFLTFTEYCDLPSWCYILGPLSHCVLTMSTWNRYVILHVPITSSCAVQTSYGRTDFLSTWSTNYCLTRVSKSLTVVNLTFLFIVLYAFATVIRYKKLRIIISAWWTEPFINFQRLSVIFTNVSYFLFIFVMQLQGRKHTRDHLAL